MRILVLGAGGVGAATAAIARRRDFFDRMVLADLDPARAQAAIAGLDDGRFAAVAIDASDRRAIVELARAERADLILNACDPRLNPPIFEAALEARCTYLDMAMTLSRRHAERPYELPGVKLGDEQFAAAREWERAGLLALVGIGVEPGLSDVFARYAADHLFSRIDEIGVRDGADLAVSGYAFAPTFSIWTTIEECLNPPLVWERERGFYTTEPFSEPEVFDFPEGIGPIECVNVGHARNRHRRGRRAASDLPLPRRRQRADDARVRVAGGRPPDCDEPRDRIGAARDRGVERRRRARSRGLRRRAVPRAARRAWRGARPARAGMTEAGGAAVEGPARPRPGLWPGVALLLGAAMLVLVLLHPGIDESWENHPAHFWLVLGAA